MKKKDLPSAPQARLIARVWAKDLKVMVPQTGYIEPTLAACLKRRWLVSNGAFGSYPNGVLTEEHVVSPDGLAALEFFLRDSRISEAARTKSSDISIAPEALSEGGE